MKIPPRDLLLLAVLWAAMCFPLWLSRYPPLWDYTDHLLEAQIVAHYQDPGYDFSRLYILQPKWYLASNALVTIILAAVGKVLPMPLAGRLFLSLDLAVLVSGLWRFLDAHGKTWPLVLLAPILAYNFTFTGGFLNFNLAMALGLHALAAYIAWEKGGRASRLLELAGLMFLIYLAHLAAWALLVLAIAALSAGKYLLSPPTPFEGLGIKEKKSILFLWLALCSALPLLLFTRPALALAGVLIAPLVWLVTALLRWAFRKVPLSPKVFGFVLAAEILLGAALVKGFWPMVAQRFPEIDYNIFNKLSFPFRLFALPNQYEPPNPALSIYNLVLVALLLLTTGLLAWSTARHMAPDSLPWGWALLWLAGLYVVIPTRTGDITLVEPRVLLAAVFVALGGARLAGNSPPSRRSILQGDWLTPLIPLATLALCLFSLAGIIAYILDYRRQSHAWDAQLSRLPPQRYILVLNPPPSQNIDRPLLERLVSSYHGAVLYSTTYTLQYGGFNSRTFDNGPVAPRPGFPVPLVNRAGFSSTDFIQGHCPALREAYDAVLFWGLPAPDLANSLDACFSPGQTLPDMEIWKK